MIRADGLPALATILSRVNLDFHRIPNVAPQLAYFVDLWRLLDGQLSERQKRLFDGSLLTNNIADHATGSSTHVPHILPAGHNQGCSVPQQNDGCRGCL